MTHMFGRFIYIIDSKGITITAHTLSSGLDKLFGKKKEKRAGRHRSILDICQDLAWIRNTLSRHRDYIHELGSTYIIALSR